MTGIDSFKHLVLDSCLGQEATIVHSRRGFVTQLKYSCWSISERDLLDIPDSSVPLLMSRSRELLGPAFHHLTGQIVAHIFSLRESNFNTLLVSCHGSQAGEAGEARAFMTLHKTFLSGGDLDEAHMLGSRAVDSRDR